MRRGDVVVVAATGDYGKPRPAVIVQTDAMPLDGPAVIVCQMTSEIIDAPDVRVIIEPMAANGLKTRSQIMVDKPVTVRRERVGRITGRLAEPDISRLNAAIGFVMGLAD
jgi:mRNA interferase MazF